MTMCAAHHITWCNVNGYQCLNCGARALRSWDIKHTITRASIARRLIAEVVAERNIELQTKQGNEE